MSFTVLSERGPLATPGLFAATSLSSLTASIDDAANGSPTCLTPSCFSDVHIPPNSLLVVFSPSRPCYTPTGYAVTLSGTHLQITTRAKDACSGGGGGGSRQIADTLIAIPTSQLPHVSTLTITAHSPGIDDQSTTTRIEH